MAEVTCDYKWNTFYGHYQCEITNQSVPAGAIALKVRSGDGKSSGSIKGIQISFCDMPALPQSLQVMFPQVEVLRVVNCTLAGIGREHIGGWRELQRVYIQECKVRRLEGDTFRGLAKLEIVSFEKNMLEEIEPDIFDGLKRLSSVDLRGNLSIDMAVEKKLSKIKREIEAKCRPKGATVVGAEVEELREKIKELNDENDKILVENAQLKLTLENHEKLIEKLLEHQRNPEQVILTDLKRIFADPAFKDFTINTGKTSFKIHKLLFAARSPTLAELLRNNPEARELNLRDIPESTFKAVHDFIYNDQLPADANYLEIFGAASLLKIDDLKEVTAAHLIENIDESNCLKVLELSNKFEHEQLRMKSFEIIRRKIFPDRELSDELAKQPEKMRKLIEAKKRLDREFEDI